MKEFEMPETNNCKCKENLTYNKENKTCIECLKAQKTVSMFIDTVLGTQEPELISKLLFIMLQKEVDKEKENKKND